MAARARSNKTGSRSKSKTTTQTTRNRRRSQKRTLFNFSLRPEHRRELFALALIFIALATLIFFLTGTTGSIGTIYVLGMQQVFGAGAVIVPVALGVLGVAILIQERLSDTRFASTNVLGIVLVLTMLLVLLEFPQHIYPFAHPERFGKGGGLVGYAIVNLLDIAIGRPAALLIVIMLLLVGILLTFNITLRELVPGMAGWLHNLWQTVLGEPSPPRAAQEQSDDLNTAIRTVTGRKPPPAPNQAPEDVILTPIAERPTRASLFRRAEEEREAQKPKPSDAQPAAEAAALLPDETAPTPAPQPANAEHPASPAAEGQEAGARVQERLESFDVPVIHMAWPLPTLNLLDTPVVPISNGEQEQVLTRLARRIEETLQSFKVEAQVIDKHIGPVVTQFELQPAIGVKISKITTLEKDLALALAAPSIRIEAPIPGKSVVGIEIPNPTVSLVTLRHVVDSPPFEGHKGKLKLPLGKDVSGTPIVADMTRMPHLLVAGSTGSGKSVAINAFLCGLLLKHTPEELRFILIDPKMVELTVYNRVPHLLSPVVTELERVVPTLRWATREMERRYKIFARHGCRNLESYLQRARQRADLEPMPYIILIIDELADLMMMAPDDVETQICRLAQMARATGIHLIIATQRPSVDVITGLIKANFPSRIAFAVTSQVDSRVILDTPGAERLLGRGDMLYMAADSAKLQRMQGTYVSDKEVENIVQFWRDATPPDYNPFGKQKTSSQKPAAQSQGQAVVQASPRSPEPQQHADRAAAPLPAHNDNDTDFAPPSEFLSTEEQETLLPKAVALVQQHKRASASLLQRRLRIGYSKAAQLIELLEQQGVVGPAETGRSREVIQQNANPDIEL
jgi:DNA segregation ATPase FtsK/SpoIIIE, S-DNA-T family